MRTSTALSLLAGLAPTLASYAPSLGSCEGVSIRAAGTHQQGNQTLNSGEAAYIAARQVEALGSLKTYLGPLAAAVYGAPLSSLNVSTMATLGLAISGGGDRAALYGAGALAAFNGQNPTGLGKELAGVLQSSSYISALSGGSWFLSSLLFNDYPASMYDLVMGNSSTNQTGWQLDINILTPGNASQQALVLEQILADLALKKEAGPWNVTYGDVWARSLSRHFLPGTTTTNFFDNTASDHGASSLFSSATTLFGSYDPELASFLPTAALGTSLNAGTPVGQCVSGFDNSGYILGISSNLWVQYNLTDSATWTSAFSPVNAAWTAVNASFYDVQPHQRLDISAVPNPFKGISVGRYEDSNQDQLWLLDGGLDGQVDPLAPLLVPARAVDTIIIVDATADSAFNKPTGDSLVATLNRLSVLPNGTQFLPPLPKTTDVFISQGLNVRPTFFGCNGTPANLSGTPSVSPYALFVYLPNADPTGTTNTTTGQLAYNYTQQAAFLNATVALTSRGIPTTNGTADPLWPTCLACAVVERTRGKTGVDRTAACTSCFSRYCWSENSANGTAVGGNSTTGTGAGKSAGTQMRAGWAAVALSSVVLGLAGVV